MSGLSVMMSKGERPAIISNISTPSAHQSTLNPGGSTGLSGQGRPGTPAAGPARRRAVGHAPPALCPLVFPNCWQSVSLAPHGAPAGTCVRFTHRQGWAALRRPVHRFLSSLPFLVFICY